MVRENQILTKEGIILNVGDLVEITKSDENWTDKMDKFHGNIVIITQIIERNQIIFLENSNWYWKYSDNHFKPISKNYELW